MCTWAECCARPTTVTPGTDDRHRCRRPPGAGTPVGATCGLRCRCRWSCADADGGESWRHETDGLHATYARAIAISDGIILLSTSRGPGGHQAALYRRSLSDEAFERCTDGLPQWFSSNIDTACLVASGPVALFGTEEGSVFLSEDRGETWGVLAEDLPTSGALVSPDGSCVKRSHSGPPSGPRNVGGMVMRRSFRPVTTPPRGDWRTLSDPISTRGRPR